MTLNENQFKELSNLKKGDYYIDKGFVSTTKSETKINEFFGNSQYQLKIIIKGKSGVDISAISDNKSEQEILFNKNTEFKVLNIKINKKEYAKNILLELAE
jgi:hypothetical protein